MLKKQLKKSQSGIAPLLALGIVGILTFGAVAVGYLYLAQPDITYNISEGIFSFAGVDVSLVTMIGVVVIVIFAILFFFRKKPTGK